MACTADIKYFLKKFLFLNNLKKERISEMQRTANSDWLIFLVARSQSY